MADFAKESGHFYTKQGEPAYTIIGANGKERNTTLRDCKKLGLVPSVTEIIKLSAKPGLDQWKQDQTILACLTLPKVEGETEQDYIKRIKEDAKAQAKKAADKGTEIHGYIERGFRAGGITDWEDGFKYYLSVNYTLEKECGVQQWSTEKSFASPLGYGGKTDLHSDAYLIDFKGTDKDINDVKLWDEHFMQLSAYNYGLPGAFGRKCGICYVHRDTAESRLMWAKPEDLEKGWKCFEALLGFYYAKTGLQR